MAVVVGRAAPAPAWQRPCAAKCMRSMPISPSPTCARSTNPRASVAPPRFHSTLIAPSSRSPCADGRRGLRHPRLRRRPADPRDRRAHGVRGGPREIVGLLAGRGVRLAAVGLAIGPAGAGPRLATALAAPLRRDRRRAPSIWEAPVLVLAPAACYLPASRAARIDPVDLQIDATESSYHWRHGRTSVRRCRRLGLASAPVRAQSRTFDVVVYGGTAGGVITAVSGGARGLDGRAARAARSSRRHGVGRPRLDRLRQEGSHRRLLARVLRARRHRSTARRSSGTSSRTSPRRSSRSSSSEAGVAGLLPPSPAREDRRAKEGARITRDHAWRTARRSRRGSSSTRPTKAT